MAVYSSAMALSIKSEEADRLARAVVGVTGETITEAIVVALHERLERLQRGGLSVTGRLGRLADDVAKLAVHDDRDPDDLVGYDEHGLPA